MCGGWGVREGRSLISQSFPVLSLSLSVSLCLCVCLSVCLSVCTAMHIVICILTDLPTRFGLGCSGPWCGCGPWFGCGPRCGGSVNGNGLTLLARLAAVLVHEAGVGTALAPSCPRSALLVTVGVLTDLLEMEKKKKTHAMMVNFVRYEHSTTQRSGICALRKP